MDRVYSAIPASMVGRQQEIEVGPMSGKSNVVYWLESRKLPSTEPVVDRVFQRAKASRKVLTEAEILAEVYR
jgi:2-isopropylmalate synthase